MKTLMLLVVLTVALVGRMLGQVDELNGGEIARVMGLHHWRFPPSELPARFQVEFFRVADGKLQRTDWPLLVRDGRGEVTVVYEPSETGERLHLLFQDTFLTGRDVVGPRRKVEAWAFHARPVSLDNRGTYLLFGVYKKTGGRAELTGNLADLTAGIAIRFTPVSPPKTSEQKTSGLGQLLGHGVEAKPIAPPKGKANDDPIEKK